MKNDFFFSVKQVVKYWWIAPLIGIIAILLGFWCIANPGSTLAVLGALFIVGFLASGVFSISFAVLNRKTITGWGWTLASGIIDILFGLILLAIPLSTIVALLFLVGFWVMFQSIWGISTSIELQRNGIKGWGWILTFGILGLILAFMLIVNPLFAAGFIIYLLAASLFCYGIMRILYGIRLRTIHKELSKFDKE